LKLKQQEHSNSNFWKRIWNETDITAKTNIVLAFTSIVSLFLIYFMSYTQNRISREALLCADTSNIYTRKSVKISQDVLLYQRQRDSSDEIRQDKKDSLFIADQKSRDFFNRESFKVENKAYIVFQKVESESFSFNGGLTTINMTIKNVGKTPALKIMPYTYYTLDEDSLSEVIHSGEKFLERHKFEGNNLGCDGTLTYVLHLGPFNKQDSILFVTNKPKFYIGGIINYFDIFNVRHFTRFCFERIYGLNEARTYKRYNEMR
jgi:hypothetical protein